MTVPINPPPLNLPAKIQNDKELAPFFTYLIRTFYQLWKAVRGASREERVTTTDATPTPLLGVSIPDGTTTLIVARVVARRTAGTSIGSGTNGDSAFYELTGAIKNIGGTLTLAGGAFDTVSSEDDTSWDVTFAIDGDSVFVTATGANDVTINWTCSVSAYEAGL